jgi:hypothetical protein
MWSRAHERAHDKRRLSMKPLQTGRATSLLSCLLLPAAAALPMAAAAQPAATKLDLLFVVDNSNSGSGKGNLKPSCSRSVDGEALPSNAFPPRRLVQLARDLGEHGSVQSICQDDLEPAISGLVERLAAHL